MNAVIEKNESRARLTQLAVFISLLVLAMALALLADGPWSWNGGPTRVLLALGAIAVFAAVWKLSTRRPEKIKTIAVTATEVQTNTNEILTVFYASQTGTAEILARQAADALRRAGQAATAQALDEVDQATLESLSRALFIASTTDDGDPPYPVAGFVRKVLESPAALHGLQFGLLALGDSYYDEFCGFGRRLDSWLKEQGAQPLFPRIDVDDNDPSALEAWQSQIAQLTSTPVDDQFQARGFSRWRLLQRTELNPGSQGEPVFQIKLAPEDGPLPNWDAGDIAEIRPQHSSATIDHWLEGSGLDGNTQILTPMGTQTLAERLARSELPDPAELGGRSAAEVAETLIELRARDYSIASLPADGHVELVIRQGRRDDGSLTLGAGWLTRDATNTDCIALRLRSNPNFKPPDNAAPLILIGNGTGLAGLRALLRDRIAHGRLRNWLLFGERQQACDFYYRDELESALAKGQLSHLDLAFSRDGPQRVYVQHRLAEQSDRLIEWVNAGATVCVCGSQDGMAGDVDACLRRVLGDAKVQQLIETGHYRRDVY